jgi:hypothetical protein
MRIIVGIIASLAPMMIVLAAAAQTPASDTIQVMLEKGAVFQVDNVAYGFAPKADGSYGDGKGGPGGAYRVVGASLCLTPATYGQEVCFELPAGKKSGDTFDVQAADGQALVTIN